MTKEHRPRICFYGDDFTGATDTLATATEAGLRSLLFLCVPDRRQLEAAGELDCLGIAGAARSMAPDEMREELEPVARFFAGLQAPVTHYKICSTFDSAPHVGNIGAALSVWRRHVDNDFVPIVGGQPNLQRYCLFSNLHAAVNGGGEVFRIDRHQTMRNHPVTPMHEADMRVHLAEQGMTVAAIHAPAYEGGVEQLDAEVDRLAHGDHDAVLFDVGDAAHLPLIGRQIWQRAQRQRLLAIGASSVVQALCGHWRGQGELPQRSVDAARVAAADGAVFVLAGSLSPVTARQVAAARSYERIALDARRLIDDDQAYLGVMLSRIAQRLNDGRHVLACTADGAHLDGERVALRLAQASGDFLHRLLPLTTVRRIGVAGGDTSSHALKALDIWGLSYLGKLSPGVALCRAHADGARENGIELMLKGGQMGGEDLFDRLVNGA
ncbi:four-carbon acid sugar kinase family protein [Herbaspirillum sp. RV1423]|uniref:four-carbon acid sugar kinase family protein n=1 Tax=Herbaspirillum sp. RV1423 TaxID=1443993 RepID=UPI0004B32361|nr:four-carbon acid sugar kinase family protein [Herbaspirillum sp. RV1423]